MQALLDTIAAMPLPQQVQRLFHGRGGLHPGCEQWVLDAYPPVFVLTSFAPVDDAALAQIGQALAARWAQMAAADAGPLCWVFQQRGVSLRLQARSDTRLMAGAVPQPHVVAEDDARYQVQVLRGQNHGLFPDMAEGRRWVRAWAADFRAQHGRGPRVLNLFAYTCAFSVAALQGGAAQVTNVDMARGPLAVGQANHMLNGLTQGARFWAHDVFTSWARIRRGGPYDLVIADPPSYQKGSFIAGKDYARVLRQLPALLAPGGHALLCLNAPELPMHFLQEQVQAHAPALAFVARLPNPPAFADVAADRALKVGVWRLEEGEALNACS